MWRNAVQVTAFLSYLTAFLFFVLAIYAFRNHSAAAATATMDLLVAIYFTLQVIFVFSLYRTGQRHRT